MAFVGGDGGAVGITPLENLELYIRTKLSFEDTAFCLMYAIFTLIEEFFPGL